MKTELELRGFEELMELVERFKKQTSELWATLDDISAVRLKLVAKIDQPSVGADG